ncbi:MFS transporter [Pseudoflavitalea sp. X16]|uniref:MFS transporter n=1 Tax=Paraflavitalea devenefica TaxID=2716334 RepID=UPI0014248632|nr:MFS transporter [Paraflavitalea devenefica]NII29384.1 MFS transporter [Paraflavitalea devenefica]
MEQTIYFNNRIGRHLGLVRILLLLVLFAAIAQFASFGIIQAHVVSFYGAQSEDITFVFQIAYVGIIATLPIMFRMVRFFNTRSYLLTAFLIGILLNIGCLFVHDLVVFSVLRFFIGIITALIAGCMLIVIFSTLPAAKSTLVGVSLFFSLILTGGLIIGIGASRVVPGTDWTALYDILISLQVIAVLLCLLIFKPKPARKPYPLYQIDWFGYCLFIFGVAAAAFVMIYGPKRYWLADPDIRNAMIFAIIMITLFLYRQTMLKRPLIDLSVFGSGKFIVGIILMLVFFGIKDTINFIYGYSASVLGWSSKDVVNAGLFNVAGVIIATFIVVKVILAKKQNLPKLLLAGFAIMFIYHAWGYLYLTPDLSFAEICIPVFLQGFASGLLFVPISILCLASIPQNSTTTGITVLTYARFTATLNSIAGFYTLQLHYNQQYKESFLGKLVPGSEILSQRQELYKVFLASRGFTPGEATGISNMLIAKTLGIQSQLLTIRAIFLMGAIITATAFVILIIFAVINKIKAARASSPTLSGSIR